MLDNHIYVYHRNRLLRAVRHLRTRQLFSLVHKMRLDMVWIRRMRGNTGFGWYNLH